MNELFHLLTTLSFQYVPMLVIPAIFLFFFFLSRRQRSAVVFADHSELDSIPYSGRQLFRPVVLGLLFGCALLLLTISAARPYQIRQIPLPHQARNLMLSLDISRSMAANDFGGPYGQASRIQAVKSVVNEFIDGRRGDRIGLVVFGSNSYLQSPLTADHGVVKNLVSRLQVGMAGDGTAIGDGLGLALKRVQGVTGDSRAVILLTDGVSNSGKVNPLQAARVARDLNIKVHTIGIGKKGGGGFFRLPGRLAIPQGGKAEFDEKTLKLIANLTGGVYFHASNLSDLQKVYREIDKLEKTERERPTRKQVDERFAMYAAWGAIFLLLYLLMSRTLFLRVP